MFPQIINENVRLASEDAELFFDGKVVGQSVLRDWSFVATLRGLVGDKLGEGETLVFDTSEITDDSQADWLTPNSNMLRLIYVRTMGAEHREKLFNVLSDRISGFDGYSAIEKVTQFFSSAFKVKAWSNPETRSAWILVDSLDVRKIHLLQACIPVIMPWFFTPGEDGKKFTEDEFALLKSLEKRDSEPYLAAIAKLAEKFDMREIVIRKRLEGVTKRIHETELKQAQNKIRYLEQQIHEYYSSIEGMIRDRSSYITRVYGLQERMKEGEGDSVLTDFFLCNDGVFLNSVHHTTIRFTCSGYLENWDDDKAESIIENRSSFMYDRARDHDVDEEGFYKLFKAIFLERTCRIRIYADYNIDLVGHVDTEHFDYHDASIGEYMENPHVQGFDCLGDYRRAILECLQNCNTLQAFNYCIASSRSINWADSPVMSHFIQNVVDDDRELKCYELPDGTVVDLDGAIRWANEQ